LLLFLQKKKNLFFYLTKKTFRLRRLSQRSAGRLRFCLRFPARTRTFERRNRISIMAPRSLKVLAILVCSAAPAQAGGLIGFADGLTTNNAGGWACVSNAPASVSIAAYAGSLLIGIYPLTVSRPDVAALCPGGQPHGFAFPFDPASQALFVGQTQLTLYAVAPGYPPRLLPPSTTRTFNPLPLPAGQLLGLTPSQDISAAASSAGGAPQIAIFAGGPANAGPGSESGVAKPVAAGAYGLQLPVSGLSWPAASGELLPVFGTATTAAGATVGLAAPLPLPRAGNAVAPPLAVPVNVTFAQTSGYTAIRNNVFTKWLPPGTGFAGLTGTVSLTGNNASFDEALVELGTAPYAEPACLAQNGASISAPPPISRLWAGILKSNAAGSVGIPVNFALPYPVPLPSAGACLMTWISAGYAYLSGDRQQYATTQIAAQAALVPVTAATPGIIPFGMGGEFRFTGGAVPTSVYVGIKASVPIAVDGIAATASAAPVAGPGAASAWQPIPHGNWAIQTSFLYLPAQACAAADLATVSVNGTFAVLRNGTPAPTGMPSAAAIMGLPIFSSGSQAIQRSSYAAFPRGATQAGFSGTLQPGDCLVAYSTAEIEPNAVLDVENQSTVFLRPLP
jgi:hypothetical protein